MTGKRGWQFDPDRIALGIQQPWAELILRGIKTLEVRSQPTRQRGTIYIYASKRPSQLPAAAIIAAREQIVLETLPFGVLVGAVDLIGCRECRRGDEQSACVPHEHLAGRYAWELTAPRRFSVPLEVRFLPYGIWFYPFKRRSQTH